MRIIEVSADCGHADTIKSIAEQYNVLECWTVPTEDEEDTRCVSRMLVKPENQQKVIDAITESLNDPTAHKYQSYQGLPELRDAMAGFYREHFSVHLSPMTEILPLIGSKEGIMHISMAFLNEYDELLIHNPGYPTYQSVTKLVGAIPVF